jgi:hypothetical protein
LEILKNGHFGIKKKKKLLDPHENQSQYYVIKWMGLNFDVFPGFQQIPCYA